MQTKQILAAAPLQSSLNPWNYLKKTLKELELNSPQNNHLGYVLRTKANCLRICCDEPIPIVCLDSVWYRQTIPEVIERVPKEHLIDNQTVTRDAFSKYPSPGSNSVFCPSLIGA